LYFLEEYLKKYRMEMEMRDKSKLEVTESEQSQESQVGNCISAKASHRTVREPLDSHGS
jgi:hypothetical protein